MIWDFIRDFFVQYIFGGYTSDGNFWVGMVGYDSVSLGDEVNSTQISYQVGILTDNQPLYITLGDWLSTTMTIICLVLISVCFILLVRWLFKAVASAFLLK